MLVFPKLPKLRGKHAVYEANGTVSSLERNPYWRAGDVGQSFQGARLHVRHPDAAHVELAVLNFAKLHAAAAHACMKLERIDNNGYHWHLAAWTKRAPDDWKRS